MRAILLLAGLALASAAALAQPAPTDHSGHGGDSGHAGHAPAAPPDPHAGHKQPQADPHAGHGSGHGTPAPVGRSIAVVASDTGFDVTEIRVGRGETVRIVVRNDSEFFVHEFTIGTAQVQSEHQRVMQKLVETGMLQVPASRREVHEHGNSILLEPGETREILWTAEGNVRVEFGCSVPGHYDAGKRGSFVVGAAPGKEKRI